MASTGRFKIWRLHTVLSNNSNPQETELATHVSSHRSEAKNTEAMGHIRAIGCKPSIVETHGAGVKDEE